MPSIDNADIQTSLSIVQHSTAISVVCGEETVVIKCLHGAWDKAILYCPGFSPEIIYYLLHSNSDI